MIGIRVSASAPRLQISNIWQASHAATGKCISSLTALPVVSWQLPVGRRMAAATLAMTFTNDKFIHAVALCHVFLFFHFHCQEKPLKLQNVLNLSQSKEKCDIDRTRDCWKRVKICVCATSIRIFLCLGFHWCACSLIFSWHSWRLIDFPLIQCVCVSLQGISQ